MEMINQGLLGSSQFDIFADGEPSVLAVNDAAALDVTANNTVVRADAQDQTKMPAIGFVKSIVGSVVLVQPEGSMSGFTGLVLGRTYWVDPNSPGKLTDTAPIVTDFPSGGVIQVVGQGRDGTTVLHIGIESSILV